MNDYGQYFYGTLPPDTQDFTQVLRGVGRSLSEIGRSTQYLPYDILGAPVDLATMAMRPFGYQTETPVGGSDWLINLARQYGIADKPTGSGIETATRLATGVTSPLAVPRAIGKFVQGLERTGEITSEQANRVADALVKRITGNPQATAQGVIQETSMPFMQAVAPKTPGLLAPRSELGFYSALEEAVGPLQNKGTGAQFLAQLEKTPGVKPEEIKWTGLDDFLKSRQNVTKAEVQDYLAQNRVNLQEVRLGTPEAINRNSKYATPEVLKIVSQNQGMADNAALLALDNNYAAYKEITTKFPELKNNPDWAEVVLNDVTGTTGNLANLPKYANWQTPGGENYREILLTLPEPKEAKMFRDLELRVNAGERLKPEELQKYRDLVDAQAFKGQYFGPHYQEANILAHMRVNDRVVDGKKTLFIEEVQSDWHQAGRKRGYREGEEFKPITYKPDDFQVSQTESQYVTTDARGRQRVVGKGVVGSEQEAKEYFARWLTDLEEGLSTEARISTSAKVPDAPFKTTWHELTLKRAIQEAAEKGYDKIAFTTGKTQAERYDLSKQVKSIEWNTYQERGADKLVTIYPQNGNAIELPITKDGLVSPNAGTQFDGKPLDEVIGKDIAKQVTEQRSGDLSGKGLAIGGEGMKGFYDNILPKSLEKLGKKFDAKVGKTDMDGVEVWSMDITPKMRESVLTKGQPLFAATPAIPAVGLLGDEGE